MKCKVCGCESFVKGKQSGHAKVTPVDRLGLMGSNLIITACRDCGEVASMRVEKPSRLE